MLVGVGLKELYWNIICVELDTSTGCDSSMITPGWHSWAVLPLYVDYGTKILVSSGLCHGSGS